MDEKRVIKTIKKIMPGVVSIMIEKHLKDLEAEMPHEMYTMMHGKPAAQKRLLPNFLADSRGMVKVGGGTGFIVARNGLILTNKHVISDPTAEYTVILNDGRKFPAAILTRDPVNDVAIVKIGAQNLPALPLGDASHLSLGQSVIAVGNALGVFKNTVSVGIISGLSRAVTARENEDSATQELRGLIQTDAAINIGNSGGPLVDSGGKVIGVNSAIIHDAQSIGFAIPINAAERDLRELRRYGRIRRPYLGLRYLILDDNLKEKMGLSVNYGAYVIPESPHDPGVAPGSPADKAGLREKDIVLKFNRKKVDTDHPIQDYLQDIEAGSVAELLVMRAGKKFEIKVTLTERIA